MVTATMTPIEPQLHSKAEVTNLNFFYGSFQALKSVQHAGV